MLDISQEIPSFPPAVIRKQVTMPLRLHEGEFASATAVTFDALTDGLEHVALVFDGWQEAQAPLVRLHSECLTGDAFGSGRCDCGPQLREAIRACHAEGGIILYLRQEGRGIGLYNKLDTYLLQEQGLDTYEANRALHFEEDPRDYEQAAQMLQALNVRSVRLLTNNPDKVSQLQSYGIAVAQHPTGVYVNTHNAGYLRAKIEHGRHAIELP
ncbi:MAG TPA: GTP cyclohydrolase II [Jatrophihabitans sp.]|uniref:GTP cyclohydrolase II n=1 Tax=Jatrophihabitans sp. TaxID=1932789 RepID=UPI002F238FE3